MTEGIIFILATAGIVYVSRFPLSLPGSHGFYRFFAWKALLVLFLLNIRHWFERPFSPLHLVSWLLLFASLFLVLQGVRLLHGQGKPDKVREDTALIAIEKTTTLVNTGIYRYIRHPLYSSLFFLGWGIFCKHATWVSGLLAMVATALLVITARVEERENIRYFGTAYQEYMKKTKLFVPFIF